MNAKALTQKPKISPTLAQVRDLRERKRSCWKRKETKLCEGPNWKREQGRDDSASNRKSTFESTYHIHINIQNERKRKIPPIKIEEASWKIPVDAMKWEKNIFSHFLTSFLPKRVKTERPSRDRALIVCQDYRQGDSPDQDRPMSQTSMHWGQKQAWFRRPKAVTSQSLTL